MRIDGSTIMVTGASSGIGAALAPMLAERGATVGIVARREDRLAATLARCRAHAPRSRMWAVDLSDVDAAVDVVDQAWDAFGALDCLVNNAAMGKRKLLTDHTADDIDVVMRTNFMSPIRMNLAVLPRMLGARLGHDRQRRQRRWSLRHRARVRVLRGKVRHVGMDRGSSHGPRRHAHRGEAHPARRHRDRDLDPSAGRAARAARRRLRHSPSSARRASSRHSRLHGVEFFVPADLKAHVDMKNADLQGWIDVMAALGRAKETAGG